MVENKDENIESDVSESSEQVNAKMEPKNQIDAKSNHHYLLSSSKLFAQ
jgi:hypothetical protein